VKVESNAFYDKLFKRYAEVKEPNGYELVKQADNYGNLFLFNKNEKLLKIEGETINTLRLNGETYYTAVESLYYPLEDIFPQLLFLYISIFIIIGILTIILSKGLYKIYEKQIQLEKNRRELTSSIAHELKTPLGIIKAYSESIKENVSERKRDYYLDVIIDETDKMDKLVLEMLDLSKLESRAYELKKEAFCINELFSKILKKNEKLLNDKNIKINYKSDEIYEIEGDYFRLEQVIDNLLSNAMNHAKEKINITIENRVVTIENDGEHISEDKINLIWDMFYKEDESRERSERRSGIGLAIVKNILELHNMEFGALNTEFGVKFWFKI
ncbi:cell wall metabolism sensor histidine kinase WalK, partial [uncultured Clostridium sp.]